MIVSSGALDLKILSQFNTSNLSKVIKPIGFGSLAAALFGLLYNGHLGASLAYQGADTYKLSVDCSEFVKLAKCLMKPVNEKSATQTV